MSKSNYSKILQEEFLRYYKLPLGGKKVPCPYRRNEYGSYQKLAPEFQGKSSAKIILETTQKLAKEQNFNLQKATVEETRQFMRNNKLGIDCSGFVYRMLDNFVQSLGMDNLQKAAGMEHIGRTNVAKMSSDEFSIPITGLKKARPGDIIKLNSGEDILHGLVVLDNQNKVVTYAHSSKIATPEGVHFDKIINGKFPDDLKVFSFKPNLGDGVRRLKILA